MRIVPVTGDLPAVVVPPPAVTPVGQAPPAPEPVVEQAGRARGAGHDQSAGQHRPRTLLPFFDPPLIAQRAALGLPVGGLIADFARTAQIPFAAASAAVDRELRDRDGHGDAGR